MQLQVLNWVFGNLYEGYNISTMFLCHKNKKILSCLNLFPIIEEDAEVVAFGNISESLCRTSPLRQDRILPDCQFLSFKENVSITI